MPAKSEKPVVKELLSGESARGIELAVTPLVFGAFGWLLDSWLGTGRWLTIGLAAFALLGTVATMWFGYDARMRELESTSRWARGQGAAADPEPEVERDLWGERRTQT